MKFFLALFFLIVLTACEVQTEEIEESVQIDLTVSPIPQVSQVVSPTIDKDLSIKYNDQIEKELKNLDWWTNQII